MRTAAAATAGASPHTLALAFLGAATDHPARLDLANEVHARPFLRIDAPARVSHLAVLGDSADAGASGNLHAQLIDEFCAALGMPAPAPGARHLAHRADGLQVKWERHAEFSTFTVVGAAAEEVPFAVSGAAALAGAWLRLVDGKRLVALQFEVLKGEPAQRARHDRQRWFGGNALVGSRVLGGGEVWCDWQIGDDGAMRFLVLDLDFRENQVGRLVQRLAEIETYRLMALLALPVARDMLGQLESLEARLGEVMRGMAADHGGGGDADRLLALTELAGQVEALSAGVNRFSAARAYDQIVLARIHELREQRIEGVPTIGEFMERRLSPAMDTCRSVQARQAALAGRISRAIDLLRTRVNVVQERQIAELLGGMHRTASTQLELQHAVEGLSVVAISYYAVSLIGHLLDGLDDLGLHLNLALTEMALVPVVLVAAFVMIRGLRKRLV